MYTTDPITMRPREVEEHGMAPAVAVEDVHKSFRAQKVLNGISLTVKQGETLAVLGRSGTGKSVLLRIIIGLEKPDSGSVRIHGQDIAGMGLDQIGEVVDVDHDFSDAGALQPVEAMIDEGAAGDLDQRLRRGDGDRSHALAETGG